MLLKPKLIIESNCGKIIFSRIRVYYGIVNCSRCKYNAYSTLPNSDCRAIFVRKIRLTDYCSRAEKAGILGILRASIHNYTYYATET